MITAFVDGDEVVITKIEFADNLTKTDVTPLGSQAIEGRTRGKYTVEEKTMEMTTARWAELKLRLPTNGFGNKPFAIVVRAEDPDTNVLTSLGSDATFLDNCTINGVAATYENSEAVSMTVLKYQPQQIRWGTHTLNQINGLLP